MPKKKISREEKESLRQEALKLEARQNLALAFHDQIEVFVTEFNSAFVSGIYKLIDWYGTHLPSSDENEILRIKELVSGDKTRKERIEILKKESERLANEKGSDQVLIEALNKGFKEELENLSRLSDSLDKLEDDLTRSKPDYDRFLNSENRSKAIGALMGSINNLSSNVEALMKPVKGVLDQQAKVSMEKIKKRIAIAALGVALVSTALAMLAWPALPIVILSLAITIASSPPVKLFGTVYSMLQAGSKFKGFFSSKKPTSSQFPEIPVVVTPKQELKMPSGVENPQKLKKLYEMAKKIIDDGNRISSSKSGQTLQKASMASDASVPYHKIHRRP